MMRLHNVYDGRLSRPSWRAARTGVWEALFGVALLAGLGLLSGALWLAISAAGRLWS